MDPIDISTPAARREVLRQVDVSAPSPHHQLLLEIFALERSWREGSQDEIGTDGHEVEHIYLAALLLYLIGDPADAPRLFEAKFRTTNFDLSIGFDAESIFGAGPTETLDWLRSNGYKPYATELSEWLATSEPQFEEWVRWKRGYFYSPTGALMLGRLRGD